MNRKKKNYFTIIGKFTITDGKGPWTGSATGLILPVSTGPVVQDEW